MTLPNRDIPDYERPVRPSDCALLIGIPLTARDFEAALRTELPDGASPAWSQALNCAQAFERLVRDKVAPESISALYERTQGRLMDELCRGIQAMGVSVRWSAKLTDLQECMFSPALKVVIVLTHSAWAPLEGADLPDVAGLLRYAREKAKGSVCAALVDDLENQLPQLRTMAPSEPLSSDFEGAIRARIQTLTREGQTYYDRITKDCMRAQVDKPASTGERVYREAFTRALLEFSLTDELVNRCRSVEFRDGMHSAKEFVKSTRRTFSGTLHLISCSSCLYSMGLVDFARKYLVFNERYPLQPRSQLIILDAVIHELSKRPAPYPDVQEWVRSNIPKTILAEG